ncbi:MAG: signal peptidase I [Patescibacteria group bacterium]|jgi:signal peptidase I
MSNEPYDYNTAEPNVSKLRSVGEFIFELVKIVVISFVIILAVRFFLMEPFYVKGASMEPNFYDHQYLVIEKLSYRFDAPKRGDVVVFRYPADPKQFFIKRVIGLPGEHIRVEAGGVYLAGKDSDLLIPESYIPTTTKTELPLKGYGDVTLGSDEYFLLGDNRTESLDSRVFGPVKKDFLIGRTWIRGWPFNQIKVFGSPDYSSLNNSATTTDVSVTASSSAN